MRSNPSFTQGPDSGNNDNFVITVNGNTGAAANAINSWSAGSSTNDGAATKINVTTSSSVASSGDEGQLRANQNPANGAFIDFDAEL